MTLSDAAFDESQRSFGLKVSDGLDSLKVWISILLGRLESGPDAIEEAAIGWITAATSPIEPTKVDDQLLEVGVRNHIEYALGVAG